MYLSHTYSDQFFNTTVAIIGPYPPPCGGVSVHIKRVKQKLEFQCNEVEVCDVEKYNTRFKRILCLLLFLSCTKARHVHYHTLYNSIFQWLLVFFFKFMRGYKLVVIDHNCRHMMGRSIVGKKILNITLPFIDNQVLIGTSTLQSYRENGMVVLAHAALESSFLPPDVRECDAIIELMPMGVLKFIEAHKPLIMVNAFQVFLWQGKDLYGIESCLMLVKELMSHFSRVGLIIALAREGDQAYYKYVRKAVIAMGLGDHIYFLIGQNEIWPLFKKIDLFVRPTLSDSFGISVQEALWSGTTVLASNACHRPSGTELYEVGNQEEFVKKAMQLLQSGR
jgi:Glycosyl transferases group 1